MEATRTLQASFIPLALDIVFDRIIAMRVPVNLEAWVHVRQRNMLWGHLGNAYAAVERFVP